MRILTRISGWPTEQYREKLELIYELLRNFERLRFIDEVYFVKAVFSAYPRAIYGPSPLVAPRVETINLDTTELDPLVLNNIKNVISRMYSKENLIARDSSLKIYLVTRFLDEKVAGSITIRISGLEKKEYGDIDLYLYRISNGKEVELFDIVKEKISNDKYVLRRLIDLSEHILMTGDVKFATIMPVDHSIRRDYGKMILAAHGGNVNQAFESHIALIRRYALYRFKNLRRRSKFFDIERKIVQKLGAIFNFGKVVGAFTSKRYFKTVIEAFNREYTGCGATISKGSYIVISPQTFGETAYPRIINLLNIMLDPFIDEEEFDKLINEAITRISRYMRS